MKIFLLVNPRKPSEFAMPACVGTWSEGYVCKACGQSTERLIEPVKVEWEPGTDVIGDFSWGGYTAIVTETARRLLGDLNFKCEWGNVVVVPPTTKSRRRRVAYPYSGPPLHWLIPTNELRLNEEGSGVTLESDCRECGQRSYTFKRDGIIIDAADWNGEKMFLIQQFERSGATFVTEEGLRLLQEQEFTNLCPRLAGEIV